MTQEERWLLEKYEGEKTEGFFADVARLHEGVPLAYLMGHVPFLNTTIFLDSHPLIPRVETEYWTGKAIEYIKQAGIETPRILDLCAGSGCIGVAIAKALPKATIHFAEIEENHHATIRKNLDQNTINSPTAIFGGHLFENTQPPYDFILSNPPYIRNNSEHVQESVKKFEPAIALYGGEDGTDIIQEIIAKTRLFLTPEGTLFIEHEPEQTSLIAAYAEKHNLTAVAHNDQYNIPRYSVLRVAQ